MQRGILGVPVRHSRNPNPGLKNQKVLPGTFPIEGGGRSQVTLKSFRKSPGNIQHAIKRVVRGVVRSKHARRRHGRSTDKTRQRGHSGHLNGSSEKGFSMRARGRTRHTNLSWLSTEKNRKIPHVGGDKVVQRLRKFKSLARGFRFCGICTVHSPAYMNLPLMSLLTMRGCSLVLFSRTIAP